MVREYVPTGSYGLLRRIVDQGPQRVRNHHVIHDDTANYLITRGLAQTTEAGLRIENTDAGRLVGLIDWDPLGAGAAVGA